MSAPFLGCLRLLLVRMCLALPDPRPRSRALEMAFGLLGGEMPKTITSALVFNEHQGDWSADYRLFSKTAWTRDDLFEANLAAAAQYGGSGPFMAAMDDSLLRKSSRLTPGTYYARDPLSPPFHTNLVLGQRFLELALMVRANEDKPFRAIPVTYQFAPPLKAPARASQAEKQIVREMAKKQNMSTIGHALVHDLRARLDRQPGGHDRRLLLAVDGSFANRTFLRGLPERTTAVCRVRKDAKMRRVLPAGPHRGNRKYGEALPTPEELLADPAVATRQLVVHNGYREVTVTCKIIEQVCWPRVTGETAGTLVLIKPLHYRLRQGDKLLYRQPCFLFVAGEPVRCEQIVQVSLARWEIEVGFRDQKSIVGVGKAQVRNLNAVARAPAFLAAAYGALLLASIATLDDTRSDVFPPRQPWQKRPVHRPSTRDLIKLLVKQLDEERNGPPTPLANAS